MQPKTYRYRAHVRQINQSYIGAAAVLALGTLALSIFGGDVRGFAWLTGFLAVEFFVLGFWLKGLATSELTLHHDHLQFRNHRRSFVLRYDELERVTPRAIAYTGGGLQLKGRGEKVNVLVTLEGVSGFVKELKGRLDAHHVIYDRSKLFSFLKTCATADHSWARMQGRRKSAGIAIVAITLAPVAFVFVDSLLVVLPVALGLGTYFVSELLFARQIAKNSDEVTFTVPARNANEEGRTLMRSALGTALVIAPMVTAYLVLG